MSILNPYLFESQATIVGIIKRMAIHITGIGIGGAMGLVSSILMLYLLVDASINGAEEPVWLMLCAIVGVFIGAVVYKIVLWSSKGSSFL